MGEQRTGVLLGREAESVGLQLCWRQVRGWVGRGTGWVERMWLRDDRASRRREAGEHRWTWVWLGQDATEADINDLVRQMHAEVARLPMPLGINDLMIRVTAWGPRRDGVGEAHYLEARRAGDCAALEQDLAMRDQPKVIAVGDPARGHVINRQGWSESGREQVRCILATHRPSRRWRIVTISLFSAGEAYLKLVSEAYAN